MIECLGIFVNHPLLYLIFSIDCLDGQKYEKAAWKKMQKMKNEKQTATNISIN
jgi:hypothetical protein